MSKVRETFVRAGAGAGKTTNLIYQVVDQALEFKQSHGRWPKTVLTTFTRKATQELKERLLTYSFREKPQALEFVQSRSFLSITTMHGLFHTFLTRYGGAVGLASEIQIVDKNQVTFWRRQILKDLLIREQVPGFLGSFGISRLLDSLCEFESIYWFQSYRPLGIRTAPDPRPDGKIQSYRPLEIRDFGTLYRNYCRKIAWKLREFINGASPGLTTEKWREYWKNLEGLIKQLSGTPPSREISFADTKISESPATRKVETDDNSEQQGWVKKREILVTLKERLNKPRKSKNNPGLSDEQKKDLDEILKTLDDFLKKEEFDPKHWPEIVSQLGEFNGFAHIFTDKLIARKKQEVALEPNDLEFFSLELIRRYPNKARNFSNDIDVWFVDEFQDTSPLQLEILNRLIAEKAYYLVGDPLQSIYFFRGARSEVFENKQKQVFESEGEIRNLKKNYRSRADLVKFFNDFFPDLFKKHPPLSGENTGNFSGEITQQEKAGYGEYSSMEPVHGNESHGIAVEISEINSEEELAEVYHISGQISELLRKGVSPRDICVLSRTHDGVDKVRKELSGLGFPVISHGHGQFFKRREILDAMGLLKFLLNPWDDDNLILLLRSPWVGLGDQQLMDVIGDRRYSFWSLFEKFFRDQKNLRSGQILCRALENKKHFGVGWCFRKALIDLGFLDFSFYTDNTGKTEANLWKLINLVEKNSRQPGQSLLKLVNEGFQSTGDLENFGDVSEAHSSVEPDKIHLMTIHASKGLEFKYVFMPFLHKAFRGSTFQDLSIHEDYGLWSLRLELGEPGVFKGGVFERLVIDQKLEREKEEFLRILYVAMTRAENQLFLSWKGEPGKKSWAFRIKNFIQKKAPLSGKISWSVVSPEKAVRYSSHKKSGKIRPPYSNL